MTTDQNERLELRIAEMDCAEEISLLKRELVPLVGSEDRLRFDLLNSRLTIDLTELGIRTRDVQAAIKRTGLRAEVWREASLEASRETFWAKHRRLVLTAASGIFGLFGFITQWSMGVGAAAERLAAGPPGVSAALYLIGIIAGMWVVLPKAWRAAIAWRPDMNLLMTIAVVGAALIGEWFEGATVAFLFSLSLLLESWSVGRARRAISALLDLVPPIARLRDSAGRTTEVHPADVSVGAVFIVRPGEKIPLDGRVIDGSSGVDQSPITGESMPVEKTVGEHVFAGAINGDGVLQIESTRPASDTALARIIKMVRDAQARRAPSEQWVERFAAVYTPAVLILATLVLLVPPLLFGGQWSQWVYRSLVLLVIACPCALVISTPVSIMASLTAAARAGVLVKGGAFIEIPARLKAIAIDKTGTLTMGRPVIVEIVPLNGHDETELLVRAGALETHSNHPLAQAILNETARRRLTLPEPQQFEVIPGKGAAGRLFGKSYWLGSHRYLQERGQESPAVQQQLVQLQRAGHTVVAVGTDDHVCGLIALADSIREDAKDALAQMRRAGVEHLIMLTGDNEGTAQAIARQAGMDDYRAELLPEDKIAAVESLVDRYQQVAMIGDGVNDAPALARASVGIAMGVAGTDAAIETADIALMSDDLSKISWLIHHSHATLAVIRQNIAFSLGIKIIFVLLTFAGFASLWMAIAADMGASLLVTFNGLRLLRRRP